MGILHETLDVFTFEFWIFMNKVHQLVIFEPNLS